MKYVIGHVQGASDETEVGCEFSLENHEHPQGTFAPAIVDGLSGKAASTKAGAMSLNELDIYVYVTDRVNELTRGQLHPITTKPGSIRSFPFAKP